MVIKKYVGRTKEEAEKKAKTEMGEDYCILYTRQLRKRFLSFMKPAQIEITVAMEEEQPKTIIRPKPIHNDAKQISYETSKKLINQLPQNIEKANANHNIKTGDNALKVVDIVSESVSDNDKTDANTDNNLRLVQERPKDVYCFAKTLYKNLLDSEVDEIYINDLIGMVEARCDRPKALEKMLNDAYEKMVLKCGKAQPIRNDNCRPKLEIFLGPTGVGKTTTIAKIAAKLVINQKRVLLTTIDNYRIGAAEQLRIYASRMGTPFQAIYTPEELLQTIAFFSEYDYIMIDTAGHNIRNEELRSQILSIIEPAMAETDSDVFLVLSSTTSYKELLEIADSYSSYFAYKIIYTKIDEKPVLGNLYNLIIHSGANVAYLTYGQTVPSDICVFNPQRLVKALMGNLNYSIDNEFEDTENNTECNTIFTTDLAEKEESL